jgi:hypothetical protein
MPPLPFLVNTTRVDRYTLPVMKTFTSETWRISLPDDWEQKPSTEQGTPLFETPDLTKGLYLATWALGPKETRSAKEIARAFCDTNETALAAMDAKWKKLHEGIGEQGGGPTILTDHFAAANAYRIITKIIARPPVVLRAAFHDYLCEDYRASTTYFTPIVDSLVLL